MNFNVDGMPPDRSSVAPGNVYKAKGGKRTVAFVVLSVSKGYAHAIGLDEEGEISSTTSYGLHVFQERDVIGFCPELASIGNKTLSIEWEPK